MFKAATNRAQTLKIGAHGPVELTITDEQGRRLGYDPETNTPIEEIECGAYRTDPQRSVNYLTFTTPPMGEYTVTITGKGKGTYRVSRLYQDADTSLHVVTTGAATEGMVTSFNIIIPRG